MKVFNVYCKSFDIYDRNSIKLGTVKTQDEASALAKLAQKDEDFRVYYNPKNNKFLGKEVYIKEQITIQ